MCGISAEIDVGSTGFDPDIQKLEMDFRNWNGKQLRVAVFMKMNDVNAKSIQ